MHPCVAHTRSEHGHGAMSAQTWQQVNSYSAMSCQAVLVRLAQGGLYTNQPTTSCPVAVTCNKCPPAALLPATYLTDIVRPRLKAIRNEPIVQGARTRLAQHLFVSTESIQPTESRALEAATFEQQTRLMALAVGRDSARLCSSGHIDASLPQVHQQHLP